MKNAKKSASEPGEGGITRRRLVKIINGVGAGIGAAVIAGKSHDRRVRPAGQGRVRLGPAISAGSDSKHRRADVAGVEACPARGTEPPSARRAEHPHRPPRRRRLRPARHARRRGPYADADAPRQRGRRLQPIPHDLDLLADAGGALDRAQSPARRLGHDRGAGARFRRLHRRHPEKRRDSRNGAARLRLQNLGLRQMAQHAGDGNDRDGAVRSLADGLRLRLLLRIYGGRDFAIRAAPVREHHSDRAAARPDLSPKLRHGGQGAGLASQAPLLRARQAVPDVLGARRSAWAPSCLQGMGRQIQRQVRRRLGRLSRARVQAAKGHRLDSRRTRSSRRAPRRWRRGTASRNRSDRSSAD